MNGGGNIVRGAQLAIKGVGRATADYMGMLATVINAMALQDVLESLGRPTRVLSAIEMRGVAEPYIRRRAMRHLEKGRVIILAGGSGHPYFSTDTTASLRGSELGAQVLLKGTKVDGVYDKDPKRHGDATRFETLSFEDVYARRLHGDGPHGDHDVPGEQPAHRRVRHGGPGQPREAAVGRAHRHLDRLLRLTAGGPEGGMAVDDVLLETEEKMEGAVTHLAGELRGLRSGRASPHLVDNVRVDYYGAMTPLGQMAQIGCPEPRLIVIKPFDASVVPDIEKAINASNLGLNPQSDGKVIRLILPPLSEERRKQLVKHVKDLGETANIAIRNVRRDGNKAVDAALQRPRDHGGPARRREGAGPGAHEDVRGQGEGAGGQEVRRADGVGRVPRSGGHRGRPLTRSVRHFSLVVVLAKDSAGARGTPGSCAQAAARRGPAAGRPADEAGAAQEPRDDHEAGRGSSASARRSTWRASPT